MLSLPRIPASGAGGRSDRCHRLLVAQANPDQRAGRLGRGQRARLDLRRAHRRDGHGQLRRDPAHLDSTEATGTALVNMQLERAAGEQRQGELVGAGWRLLTHTD